MDDTYDTIVLATGLKECILSGLLSVDGKKVFHLDRNDYYGGASASLNLKQLFDDFANKTEPPASLGRPRDYNVDVIPKFIMSSGEMVNLLLHCNVHHYLQFRAIHGSYVYTKGKVYKIPATVAETVSTPLLGFFEKGRFKGFLEYLQNYDENKPETHKGRNLKTMTMAQLFKEFKLDTATVEFVGHAVALYREDSYLEKPAIECVKKIVLYFESLSRFQKSPYIYPEYGLGELPQAFARMSALYGGTYMLRAKIQEIVFDTNGHVTGVKFASGETAKCSNVIADPSYFPDKVKKVGQVVRAICILNHPVNNTDNAESCQIIMPQAQVGRKSDIYISVLSGNNQVCPKGKWIAIVGTTVETANPEKEVEVGLNLLQPIEQKFIDVSDSFEPINDPKKDGVFITRSYDATSHFETTVEDCLDMYTNITGKKLVMKIPTEQAQ
ncbi:Rab GDP dissociation inhibitor alpha, putative [Entamoeba invadens IP1]|uniref:Rab GDP dissociation inhibitor alpha, putative n=1 Tax=Entamoeba invadens IP1 TaxID=370355 RepID=UPI0002C3F194|nr:Rab GDP dissociation inhibitor alpha, putative [Entamoeba invadens IP1]ELP94268.1 Rab GDP dissociation inhibitor alpha, putative [Entamoeba invadens IP1]|eukprot:XP_004261039.1 Rab GDP dissociation inhibitor alpha, putative [Entamoeba invadens IP1]